MHTTHQQQENIINSQVFSACTLFYARLRRVTGRVVDAVYLTENQDYARYVLVLAALADDAELNRLSARLIALLDLGLTADAPQAVQSEASPEPDTALHRIEPTAEDIYKAQVPHHYIGALR